MSNNYPQSFDPQKPYVIVCEGDDDKIFLQEYLKFLDKKCHYINQNEFLILCANGVDNIAKNTKNYKNYDYYDTIKSILFIRDADSDVERALNSLTGNIKDVWNIKLNRYGDFQTDNDKIKIGFFIFPGPDESGNYRNGTLEDLCAEVLKLPDCVLTLVCEHIQKLNENGIDLKTPHKNRLHLCLDSTNDFIGAKIGESAKRKAFNFLSDKFTVLEQKIIGMKIENSAL